MVNYDVGYIFFAWTQRGNENLMTQPVKHSYGRQNGQEITFLYYKMTKEGREGCRCASRRQSCVLWCISPSQVNHKIMMPSSSSSSYTSIIIKQSFAKGRTGVVVYNEPFFCCVITTIAAFHLLLGLPRMTKHQKVGLKRKIKHGRFLRSIIIL